MGAAGQEGRPLVGTRAALVELLVDGLSNCSLPAQTLQELVGSAKRSGQPSERARHIAAARLAQTDERSMPAVSTATARLVNNPWTLKISKTGSPRRPPSPARGASKLVAGSSRSTATDRERGALHKTSAPSGKARSETAAPEQAGPQQALLAGALATPATSSTASIAESSRAEPKVCATNASEPVPKRKTPVGMPLKLDLSKLQRMTSENAVDLLERPDSAGRAPPTPAGVVVERLKALALERERASSSATTADGGASCSGNAAGDDIPSTGGRSSESTLSETPAALLPVSHTDGASAKHTLRRGAAWEVELSEVSFGRRLGAGAYGEVYEGEWRRSKVAIKRLLCTDVDEKAMRHFFAEMEILSIARHDNVVRFLGGCVKPNNLAILFEFCPQSLYDLLRAAHEPLPSKHAIRIARQVALGIYYLHCCKPPILHLDLKSANVLLDDYGRAKVCDFGLSHLKSGAGVLTSRMGSPMWTAPEVLKGAVISEAADTYSYGMLLYELITSELPYHNVPAPQIIVGVMTNMLPRPEIPTQCEPPPALARLMRRCWQHDMDQRPSFSGVLDALDEIAAAMGLSVS